MFLMVNIVIYYNPIHDIRKTYVEPVLKSVEMRNYFSVFSPNTGKYGPEITPYLDTFHALLYNIKQVKIKTQGFKIKGKSK